MTKQSGESPHIQCLSANNRISPLAKILLSCILGYVHVTYSIGEGAKQLVKVICTLYLESFYLSKSIVINKFKTDPAFAVETRKWLTMHSCLVSVA